MMYNPQIKTFIEVADAGSFNRAAEKMFITPSAVIKQINLLENSLGLVLFERTHRGLVLTPAGQSLYKDCRYIISYCEESVARARNAELERDDIIRIGTSLMTPPKFLVEIWPRIHGYCPDIKFQFVPFDNTPERAREILGNLGTNFDIVAGIYDEAMLALHGCAAMFMSDEPVCCAVSVDSPLAGKEMLEMSDLEGQELLLMRRGWSRYVDDVRDDLMANHPSVRITDFDFYDVNVFNRCEQEGCLLMAIAKWEDVHPLLKILPVRWKHHIPFGILHAPSPSAKVRKLLDALEQIRKS